MLATRKPIVKTTIGFLGKEGNVVDLKRFRSYYTKVRELVYVQCKDRYVAVRFESGLQRHFGVREHLYVRSGDYILVTKPNGVDPTGLQYWINAGVLEFIPEVSRIYDLERTDTAIIDLDPKDDSFGFDQVKEAVVLVMDRVRISKIGGILKDTYRLRYSGNRSIHLYLDLTQMVSLFALRKELQLVLGQMSGWLSCKNLEGRKDYIYIDIGAMAVHRCVRSLWSLHHKTGKACVPVVDLKSFDPGSATIDAVLDGRFGATDIIQRWGDFGK